MDNLDMKVPSRLGRGLRGIAVFIELARIYTKVNI